MKARFEFWITLSMVGLLGLFIMGCCDDYISPIIPKGEEDNHPIAYPLYLLTDGSLFTVQLNDDIMAIVGTNPWYSITKGRYFYVAVGDAGQVALSKLNNGTSWETATVGSSNVEWKGVAASSDTGFVAVGKVITSGGRVLTGYWAYTTNGTAQNADEIEWVVNSNSGYGWEDITEGPINKIDGTAQEIHYMAVGHYNSPGAGGTVGMKTFSSDGGKTWTLYRGDREDNTYSSYYAVTCGTSLETIEGRPTQVTRYIVIGQRIGTENPKGSIIELSKDNGQTWSVKIGNSENNYIFRDVYMYGDNVVVVGDEGVVGVSTNKGDTWKIYTNRVEGDFRSVIYDYNSHSWVAAGLNGLIAISKDMINWVKIESGTTENLFCVSTK